MPGPPQRKMAATELMIGVNGIGAGAGTNGLGLRGISVSSGAATSDIKNKSLTRGNSFDTKTVPGTTLHGSYDARVLTRNFTCFPE